MTMKGKHHSLETRRKMRKARIKYWARITPKERTKLAEKGWETSRRRMNEINN